MNTEEFIKKSKEYYGDSLDYTNVIYVSAKTKVLLHCKIHKIDYTQVPNHHFNSKGCSGCAKNKRSISRMLDQNTFIEKSNQIYNKKYEYGEYLGAKKNIKIKCTLHNTTFYQTPDSHYISTKCEGCILYARRTKFINDSSILHNKKYSYDNVVYLDNKLLVSITCSIHGDFNQTPSCHRQGKGCPQCSITGFKTNINGYFYIQELTINNKIMSYKFGITNKNPVKRMKIQSSKSSLTHNLFFQYNDVGTNIMELEKIIKSSMDCSHIAKDKMKDGYTETISPDDIDKLEDIVLNYILKE